MSSPTKTSDWQLYKRLLGYAWPFRWAFVLSFIGFMLFAAMDVLAADIMQFLIDSLGGGVDLAKKTGIIVGVLDHFITLKQGDLSQARILIPIILICLSITRAFGNVLGNFLMRYVGANIIHKLRCEIFEHLALAPIDHIDSQSQGKLISRITFNVTQITSAVSNGLTVMFRDGLLVIFMFSYLIYINWKLTLTFIIVAPFIAIIISYVSRRFRRLSKRLQDSMGDITHVVSEAVSSSREIRIYGAQKSEIKRFFDASHYSLKQQLKIAFTDSAFSPTIQILLTVAISILIWLGLSSSVVQSMTPGLFVTYLVAAGAVGKPLRQLTQVLNVIQKALAAAQDIFQQLDTPIEEELGEQTLDSVKGDIVFDGVSFTYPTQQEKTLNNVSFSIPAGQMVALVGASGGGKSTIASLIPRFYNIEEGEIRLDNTPVQSLSLANLRSHIAIVSQNVVLLNDTIFNNIAYGQMREATAEQVLAAAKQANAHEFISDLENGYDTMVGDNGLRLSGGQRQRLAIARAILKDASVLILDEATSALDNESERYIQQSMIDVAKGRTTLVIAHRLSTIEQADLILVVDQGEIVEQGTHSQLLAQNGKYAQLHQESNGQLDG